MTPKKISPEVEAILGSAECQEYERLHKRRDRWWWIIQILAFLIFVPSYIGGWYSLAQVFSNLTGCFIIIAFYGFFGVWALILGDEGLVNWMFNRAYAYTNSYQRVDFLTWQIEETEKEIKRAEKEKTKQEEERATRLLNGITQTARENVRDTRTIVDELWRKRVWRDEYAEPLQNLIQLQATNSEMIALIAANKGLISRSSPEYSTFQDLHSQLVWVNDRNRILQLKMAALPDFLPPAGPRTGRVLGEGTPTDEIAPSGDDEENNKQSYAFIQRSGKFAIESEPVPDSDADVPPPLVTLTGADEVPASPRRKGVRHDRIVKGSKYIYQQQLGRNMDIGLKGELLVMDYEAKRLTSESIPIEGNLQHASVEIGDGLGYDITSVKDGRKICIEVKTTVGDFWSGLYFTENEFTKMEAFGEDYHLYRICRFSEDDNTGDLFIYSGKEMITDTFEFRSKMYVLEDRNRTN